MRVQALLLIAVCTSAAALPRPGPEIERLVTTFSGTWSIVLKTDPNDKLPKGGTGHGEVVWRPGPGALSLIEEYHSTGDEEDFFWSEGNLVEQARSQV